MSYFGRIPLGRGLLFGIAGVGLGGIGISIAGLGFGPIQPGSGSGILSGKGDSYLTFKSFQASLRHLNTIKTVASIVFHYKTLSNPAEINSIHKKSAKKLLELFKQNGGVYIKIGQHISSLTYLLPVEYTETMIELQDHCPQSTKESIKRVFYQEMGRDLQDCFSWIDLDSPIGCASLAQVHVGEYLTRSGEYKKCALKIQHDYLDIHAPVDIATCSWIGKMVKKYVPEFEFDWLVDEMAINLPLELDFRIEQGNADRCRELFDGFKGFKVPCVYDATRRVLVMEYCEGVKVTNQEYLKKHGLDPKQVSTRIGRVFSEMIFKHQFLHCDPHAGNILVHATPQRRRNSSWIDYVVGLFQFNTASSFEIVLLDHGLYRRLDKEFVNDYARFWISILNSDEKGIEKYCYRMFLHPERQNSFGNIHYHRLFASMISGRSWDTLSLSSNTISTTLQDTTPSKWKLVPGIANPRSVNERMVVQRKAGTTPFLSAIALILQKCRRELLLVMKTNDLVRGIYSSIGAGSDRVCLVSLASDLGWSCLDYVWRNEMLCDSDTEWYYEVGMYGLLSLKLLVLDTIIRMSLLK